MHTTQAVVKLQLKKKHSGLNGNQSDQLSPVGLIAQLVEHYTSIAEVMGSNPIQARNFLQALISQLLKMCA